MYLGAKRRYINTLPFLSFLVGLTAWNSLTDNFIIRHVLLSAAFQICAV